MPDDALTAAADAIVRAILDPGPQPKHHFEQLRILHDEWPTLFHAIAQLMAARGHPLNREFNVQHGGLAAMSPYLERKLRDSL